MRRRIGTWLLRLVGWRIAGQLPLRGTYVVIGAPHTSNWDFYLGLSAAAAFGVKISWLGSWRATCGGTLWYPTILPVPRFSPFEQEKCLRCQAFCLGRRQSITGTFNATWLARQGRFPN